MTLETGTILDKIVAAKRDELADSRIRGADSFLGSAAAAAPVPVDFREALARNDFSLIAEIKRASPTKGMMAPDLDPVKMAAIYAESGASAISVLTEKNFFLGTLDEMLAVRTSLEAFGARRPAVLRKDFVFDPYQVQEARLYGADAILLIVAILEPDTLSALLARTRELGMEALVEVHDEREMAVAAEVGATVIGINNRDLKTFITTLEVTERLAPFAPPGAILVSESGIHTAEDIARVRQAGARAVLVGESIVTAADPREQIGALYPWPARAASR